MVMGVYSNEGIKELLAEGIITSIRGIRELESTPSKIEEGNIQPGSLDLRIGGGDGYCLHSSSLPPKKNLENFFSSRSRYSLQGLTPAHYLHKGFVYVFPLLEKLNLPKHLFAKTNPKSTTGRTDIHTRVITESGYYFDNIPSGYQGKLWLEIFPRSFDVRLREGDRLTQLRIFDNGSSPLNREEIICLHREEGILYKGDKKLGLKEFEKNLLGNILLVSSDLRTKPIGYSAKEVTDVVDLNQKLPKDLYFNEVKLDRFGGITIEEGGFGIFGSYERVKIPLEVCAEMVDVDTGIGEFRSHYAGFFDPGFDGQSVLEMRNLGPAFSFSHRQKIAGFKFYHMKEKPTISYGDERLKSSYQKQRGPRLAKWAV